jgi:hypothetical protein
MSVYQIFFDGLILGLIFGFLSFYVFFRIKVSRLQKPRSQTDRLIEDIQDYFRSESEGKRKSAD